MDVVKKFSGKRLAALAMLSAAVGLPTAASAAQIVLVGNNNNAQITSFLNANGHTVIPFAAGYAGADVVILLRSVGDVALQNWVLGGGKLLTEWSGADWALNTANLINADVSGGGFIGTNTTITFTSAGSMAGLGDGVGSSFSAAQASEFARNITNVGAGAEIWATRPGGNAVIVAGQAGSGFVIANGLDWADAPFNGSENQQVLLNSLKAFKIGAVPEPTTWAMMLLGFGFIGGAMRSAKRKQKVTVSYA
jgi:PEP-CTERM motif